MQETKKTVNREHKDRLFKLVFQKKEDLLDLYNAVNGTDYDNPDDVEVNTIEDAVYLGMKNDVSFLVKDVLNLYEHQSTVSPNLPLRGLFYLSGLYRKVVSGKDIYSSKLIPLPLPQFVVFYNGMAKSPERQVLELSDAFPGHMDKGKAALQCRAVVLNINAGHNKELMARCRQLREYSQFVGKIREFLAKEGVTLEEAVDAAVEYCIANGILEKLLREHRAEVYEMVLFEYDEEAHIASEKEISREEGLQEGLSLGLSRGLAQGRSEGMSLGLSQGRSEGMSLGLAQGGFLNMISLTKKKLQRGKSLPEIAQDLEEDEAALKPIFLAVQKDPQKSPEEILKLLSENK